MDAQRKAADHSLTDRRGAQWLLLAAVLLWAVLAVPCFQGCLYGHDDLTAYHLPTRQFYAQCLATGESFDWCPALFGGFYLTGEGQSGTYHPWHWAAYRWLPFHLAFDSEVLLPFPVMLAGMYLLLRRHMLACTPAMWGAVVFAFSTFHVLHFMHVNALAILAHLPWSLYFLDMAACSTRGWRRAAAELAVGLLTASQVLLGYPQYAWFVGLAEIWYLVFLCTSGRALDVAGEPRRARLLNAWGWYVTVKCLGLAVGMIQLAPTADLLAASTRSMADADLPFTGSWHPWNSLQWVAPYLFATRVVGQNTPELASYLGAVPVVLVIWLAGRRRGLESWAAWQRATWLLVVVALLLAGGEHTGWYWLQTWLPLVGRFRFPCRYLCLVNFGTAVLAAMALDAWLRDFRDRDTAAQSHQRLWYPVVAGCLVAGLSPWLFPAEHLAGVTMRVAGPVLLLLATSSVLFVARGHRLAVPLLALVTTVDLGTYGLSHGPFRENRTLAQVLASTQVPPGKTGERVAAQIRETHDVYHPDCSRLSLVGWQRWDGYAGLEPQRALDYRTCQALRAAGVVWVGRDRISEKISGLEVADARWLRVPRAMPRARLVSQVIVSCDPKNDLERIDLNNSALWDAPCPELKTTSERPTRASSGTARTVALQTDRPGRIVVQTQTDRAHLLVVTESFHRGWQADIGGQPARVARANGDFLGVVVPPGTHDITLEFRPASLLWGRRVTWCALVVILAWGALRTRQRTGRPPRDQESQVTTPQTGEPTASILPAVAYPAMEDTPPVLEATFITGTIESQAAR